MSSISERLNEDYAEAWRPEAGDELIGKVTEIGSRSSDQGADYLIVTVRREDGERRAFHAFHTVAANALRDQSVSIGDEIGVRYVGYKETPDGPYKGYHDYRLVVDHPAGWSPVTAPSAAPAHEGPAPEPSTDDDYHIPF